MEGMINGWVSESSSMIQLEIRHASVSSAALTESVWSPRAALSSIRS